MKCEMRWSIIEEFMSALLRLEEDGERGIATNIDPLDRIHLTGDAKWHSQTAFYLCVRFCSFVMSRGV